MGIVVRERGREGSAAAASRQEQQGGRKGKEREGVGFGLCNKVVVGGKCAPQRKGSWIGGVVPAVDGGPVVVVV